MGRHLYIVLLAAAVVACADRQPMTTTLASPPDDPKPCKGQNQGKNDKDCFITVKVVPPAVQAPDAPCTVKVADDQDTTVFRFPYGESRWIIWRLDSDDYGFAKKDDGIKFKDSSAPFDHDGPRKGGKEYVANNKGKTIDTAIGQDWPYGISIVAKQPGKVGCHTDPMIHNE